MRALPMQHDHNIDSIFIVDGEKVPLAYSIKEFCKASSISRNQMYLEIKDGNLKTVKLGRRVLIPVAAAQEWLASKMEAAQ